MPNRRNTASTRVSRPPQAGLVFEPLKVRRTFEVVVDRIKDLIFSGQYRPGDCLPAERELARMIGVGRPAIREAYRALELIGIVEIRKGNRGGAYITERNHRAVTETLSDLIRLRQVSMTDLTEARLVLEKDVAELALHRIGSEEIARLTACAETAIAQSKNGITATEENIRFHMLLGEMSGNPILAMMLASTLDLLRLFIRSAAPGPAISRDNAEEHCQIVEALRTAKFDRLWPLLERHILKSNNALIQLARRLPSPESSAPRKANDTPKRWPRTARREPQTCD